MNSKLIEKLAKQGWKKYSELNEKEKKRFSKDKKEKKYETKRIPPFYDDRAGVQYSSCLLVRKKGILLAMALYV